MPIFKNNISILIKVLLAFGGILLLIWEWLTLFIDIPPLIQDLRIGFGLGILAFIIGTGWTIFDLYSNYVLGSNPNIKITCLHENFPVQGYTTAWLEIKNMEQTDITNCYARLMSLEEIYYLNDAEERCNIVPSLSDKKTYRIKWRDIEESDAKCEIVIPRNDSRILEVAITDNLRILKFQLCEKELSPNLNWKGEEILFSINIRVDGIFNHKPMKPQIFIGYLSVETKTVGFSDGTVKGNILIYNLSFDKKRVSVENKKIKEKDNIKKQMFSQKEPSSKALDKAIMTIKKSKSPDEDKK